MIQMALLMNPTKYQKKYQFRKKGRKEEKKRKPFPENRIGYTFQFF